MEPNQFSSQTSGLSVSRDTASPTCWAGTTGSSNSFGRRATSPSRSRQRWDHAAQLTPCRAADGGDGERAAPFRRTEGRHESGRPGCEEHGEGRLDTGEPGQVHGGEAGSDGAAGLGEAGDGGAGAQLPLRIGRDGPLTGAAGAAGAAGVAQERADRGTAGGPGRVGGRRVGRSRQHAPAVRQREQRQPPQEQRRTRPQRGGAEERPVRHGAARRPRGLTSRRPVSCLTHCGRLARANGLASGLSRPYGEGPLAGCVSNLSLRSV